MEITEVSVVASVVTKPNFIPSVLESVIPAFGPAILNCSAVVLMAPSPHIKLLVVVSLVMVVLRETDARPVVVLSIILVALFLV